MNAERGSCSVAIIGAGFTAAAHLEAFRDISTVEIAGIYSRTRERAEALVAGTGALVTDSVEELYERTSADLVIVTVPELAMVETVERCAAFDWAIFMEKPPGHDQEASLRLQGSVRASGSVVYVGLNRRCMSSTITVLDGVDGEDGERFIRIEDQQDLGQATALGHPAEVVANWMFANSIHTIDLLRVFGRGHVTDVENVMRWDPERPSTVLAKVAFSSGDVGVYEGIWRGPGPWAATVVTPVGHWEMKPLERAIRRDLERRVTEYPIATWDSEFKPGFRRQAAEVLEAISGRPSRAASLDDAVETMRLIAQIFEL